MKFTDSLITSYASQQHDIGFEPRIDYSVPKKV